MKWWIRRIGTGQRCVNPCSYKKIRWHYFVALNILALQYLGCILGCRPTYGILIFLRWINDNSRRANPFARWCPLTGHENTNQPRHSRMACNGFVAFDWLNKCDYAYLSWSKTSFYYLEEGLRVLRKYYFTLFLLSKIHFSLEYVFLCFWKHTHFIHL